MNISISLLDAIFLIIAVILTIKAALYGFMQEFFSAAAFISAAAAGFFWYDRAAQFITVPASPRIIAVAGFFTVFILVYLAVKVIQLLMRHVFSHEIFRGLDHALGFFLGIFEAGVLIFLIIVLLHIQTFFDASRLLENSTAVKFFMPLVEENAQLFQAVPI